MVRIHPRLPFLGGFPMIDIDPKTRVIIDQGHLDSFVSGVSIPRQKLSIARDYGSDPHDVYPVFTFVPDVSKPEHFHISLQRAEARSLRDWLKAYCKETKPKKSKRKK
jgi:hypothetical protein